MSAKPNNDLDTEAMQQHVDHIDALVAEIPDLSIEERITVLVRVGDFATTMVSRSLATDPATKGIAANIEELANADPSDTALVQSILQNLRSHTSHELDAERAADTAQRAR